MRRQRANAVAIFHAEAQLNLEALENLKQQVQKTKSRITAGQAKASDLWVSMLEFDFSATGPLNQAGYLHRILGAEGMKSHLSVLRFFNNGNASLLSERLKSEHEQNSSLKFIDWLESRIDSEEENLRSTIKLFR